MDYISFLGPTKTFYTYPGYDIFKISHDLITYLSHLLYSKLLKNKNIDLFRMRPVPDLDILTRYWHILGT